MKGFICPQCYARYDGEQRMRVAGSVKSDTLTVTRYRWCPVCHFKVTTIEKVRDPEKVSPFERGRWGSKKKATANKRIRKK